MFNIWFCWFVSWMIRWTFVVAVSHHGHTAHTASPSVDALREVFGARFISSGFWPACCFDVQLFCLRVLIVMLIGLWIIGWVLGWMIGFFVNYTFAQFRTADSTAPSLFYTLSSALVHMPWGSQSSLVISWQQIHNSLTVTSTHTWSLLCMA
jgi:hypothetical protein